jgi:FkbM family methyltransferase
MSLEDELHAFAEDRKEHVREVILPALAEGRTVLLDRYFYSTIAYQGARGACVEALTEPVWVALGFAAEWRWLLDRKDSPWYPTMRLFRQAEQGDWDGVFHWMSRELARQRDLRLPDSLGLASPTGQTDQSTAPVSEGQHRPVPIVATAKAQTVTKPCRHGLMAFQPHDLYIGRSLDLYGEYSEAEVRLFQKLVKPGDVVLDIGANIGGHTIPLDRLAGASGQVLAFEPQRTAFCSLCANVALNDLAQVRCHRVAVGDAAGSIQVPELDYGVGQNFGGLALGRPHLGGRTEEVPMLRIDDLKLDRCQLIKVDVEGMERQVLAGAAETLRTLRPLLYVEDDRSEHSAELRRQLVSLGYRLLLHLPPLFNLENFRGNRANVFENTVSVNLDCAVRRAKVSILSGCKSHPARGRSSR